MGRPWGDYDWPQSEHGIHVDDQGNVWLGGGHPCVVHKQVQMCNQYSVINVTEQFVWFRFHPVPGNVTHDRMILKFARDGQFLMQIGCPYTGGGNEDETHFNRPSQAVVHSQTNEVFVADGHGNQRIMVLDATTGEYKRSWGAYGDVTPHVHVQEFVAVDVRTGSREWGSILERPAPALSGRFWPYGSLDHNFQRRVGVRHGQSSKQVASFQYQWHFLA